MNYQELYQQKLTTAEEAVKVVKSGDWVDYSWCCNHPVALDKALAARKDELYDVKIHGGVTMWMPDVCKADDAGEHFTWNSWHCSGMDRKIIGKGMGYFGPIRYSELPRFYRDGNAHGCGYASGDSHGRPRQLQLCPVRFSSGGYAGSGQDYHCGSQSEYALGQRPYRHGDQHQGRGHGGGRGEPRYCRYGRRCASHGCGRKVAEMIVKEIPNGACLQLGIGGMPNTVGSLIAESDLKDLGVHTEMYVDAFVDIARLASSAAAARRWIRAVRCTLSLPAPRSCMTTSRRIQMSWPHLWITPTMCR